MCGKLRGYEHAGISYRTEMSHQKNFSRGVEFSALCDSEEYLRM